MDRIGTLYFISSDAQSAFKIGFADNLPQRLASLQSGNPAPLQLLHWLPVTYAAERMLHRVLKHHRIAREWYPIEPDFCSFVYDFLADEAYDRATAKLADGEYATYEQAIAEEPVTVEDVKALAAELPSFVRDEEIEWENPSPA